MPTAIHERNILVIINPYAGNGLAAKVYSQYFKYLNRRGIPFFPYFTTGKKDTENVRKLLQHRAFNTISILGGDGTNNMVINAIDHFDYLLHMIPCGTGNDLMDELSPRKNISSYFQAVAENHIKMVDVFRCNDRRFLVGFGIGFDGSVCEVLEQMRTVSLPKILRYWVAILKILFTFKEVELEIQGVKKKVFLLSLANNASFGGGFKIAPLADLNDEKLEMVEIGSTSFIQRLRHLLRVKNGNHLHLPIVNYKRVAEFTVYSAKREAAHVDGELLYNKHFMIHFDHKIQVCI